MKNQIRARALELGFDDCRITSADAPRTREAFNHWIETGQHGEMGYMERTRTKRVDLQLVLPGAQSVVVVAANYFVAEDNPGTPPTAHEPLSPVSEAEGARRAGEGENGSSNCSPSPQPSPPRGRGEPLTGVVARYARSTDYHDLIGSRLEELSRFLDGIGGPGTRSLAYVDTGPILERDLAQRAGLGFVGKHTNLISRRLGNWFFIGEVLTTLRLSPDEPEVNRCGSCTRCLASCPTGAITAPFQLDARRCISYLTIELKGSIPVELRPAIGNRIYGCDDCLAACPWNRFASEGHLLREHHRTEWTAPSLVQLLEELLALDEPGFKKRFVGLPMVRAKRRGLARNVCVALGNSENVAAVEVLRRAVNDPDPLIVEHARWALERLGGRGP